MASYGNPTAECKVPVDVGEFSPEFVPEDTGDKSGGEWLSCNPASGNPAKTNTQPH